MRTPLSTLDEIWQCQSRLIVGLRNALQQQIQQFAPKSHLVLGCSGGMDSMLLLYLLASLQRNCLDFTNKIIVMYVDHQLQSASLAWYQFVQNQAIELGLDFCGVKVEVATGNLEQQARIARYQAFERQLTPEDVLILAHHQQDQAETVILRLLQGTGVKGLSAMLPLQKRFFPNQQPYFLWRPFLTLTKQEIQHWITQWQIPYIDDPMNHQLDYDRVWCRQQLWTVLQQRFPQMQNNVARCATLMQDSQHILDEVLQIDIRDCVNVSQNCLDLTVLKQRSLARQRQLLAWFIQANQTYKAPFAIVQQLQHDVIDAAIDAQGHLHYAGQHFVRYADQLYRYTTEQWQNWQKLTPIPPLQASLDTLLSLQIGQFQLVLQSAQQYGLSDALLGQDLSFQARQGGEKIAFPKQTGHKQLKKCLQDAKIPSWQRPHVQCVQYRGTLLGILTPKGFWLADSDYLVLGGWTFQLIDA